jgi:DNA segregation ATPase FtsK/SpoIIIE, S-DNA-T family
VRLVRAPGAAPVTGTVEGIDQARAEQVVRALAPLRERTPTVAKTTVPYPVRLLDLLGVGTPNALDTLALWGERRGPTTHVVLGVDAHGPVTVDPAAQAAPALLGGDHGSGKSTLLRSLAAGLLLANRPDELNLVLVDGQGEGDGDVPTDADEPTDTDLVVRTVEEAARHIRIASVATARPSWPRAGHG